jgi:hypothetical protein
MMPVIVRLHTCGAARKADTAYQATLRIECTCAGAARRNAGGQDPLSVVTRNSAFLAAVVIAAVVIVDVGYRRLRRGRREDKPAPLMGQSVNLGVDVRERTLENRVRSGQSINSKSMSRAR